MVQPCVNVKRTRSGGLFWGRQSVQTEEWIQINLGAGSEGAHGQMVKYPDSKGLASSSTRPCHGQGKGSK